MRIFDAHTHMPGRSNSAVRGLESDEFLALMDANGIDQAWVFTLDGLYFDPAPHNDLLYEFCGADRRRLIPFCTVHPRYPDPQRELRRCVLELGMQGVKFHPWLQAFSPMDPAMDEIGDEIERLGIPVVFHDGTPPYSTPLQCAYFASRHPEVPVILGHGGLHDLWKEAIVAAERYANIYLVPSSMPMHGLRQGLARLGIGRFLFGSDAGFGDPYWHTFQLEKILALQLPTDQAEQILGGNARQMRARCSSSSTDG